MDKKIILKVSELKTGMKIAESIYNNFGAVIVWENTVIDDRIIDRLKSLNIQRIKVIKPFDIEYAEVPNTSEVMRAEYIEDATKIKNVFKDLSDGKNIDKDVIDDICESIHKKLSENREMINCINQVRNVDDYTFHHSLNVALLCMMIGTWLKLDVFKVKKLVKAGLLHDIGKSKIDQSVLNKPGMLSEEEFIEMKKHSEFGYMLLQGVEGVDADIAEAVLFHHEREDGSGYPMGVSGDSIGIYAKIIAVADIYDAMTSKRIYKEKDSPFKVFELMQNSSFGVLDHKVVSIFLKNVANFYVGDNVVLSNGKHAEVIYINNQNVGRPIVKCNDEFIDLMFNKKIEIVALA